MIPNGGEKPEHSILALQKKIVLRRRTHFPAPSECRSQRWSSRGARFGSNRQRLTISFGQKSYIVAKWQRSDFQKKIERGKIGDIFPVLNELGRDNNFTNGSVILTLEIPQKNNLGTPRGRAPVFCLWCLSEVVSDDDWNDLSNWLSTVIGLRKSEIAPDEVREGVKTSSKWRPSTSPSEGCGVWLLLRIESTIKSLLSSKKK